MFETEKQQSFPDREEAILAFWEKEGIFFKSLEGRRGCPLFSFYDGPPFATGLPHYGHLLAGTIKDVVPRYKTMKGYFAARRFGWDCHGLPVENEIEKARELSGAASIEAFGVAAFNEECRAIVLRYTAEWQKTVERMGRWVDFANTYRTMDPSFMESVWWAFGQLYAKGLVYEGFKVMPFSAKLGTPISNFEANLNYKDVDDPSLTVTFPLVDAPEVSFLAWTTTPWTLPSNLALAVHGDLDYVKVREKKSGKFYILAKARLSSLFADGDVEIIEEKKGKEFAAVRYKPLFPYFEKAAAFYVLVDPFVTTEEGTGIVHTAPAFGEVDFFVCKAAGIDPVCPVDQNGRFTDEVKDYAGLFVKDADRAIIKRLKEEGRVFSHGQVHHRYPFCWRSDTPLIYKAVRTWFVAVERIKERLLAANEQISWVPEHIKHGRFGKWLENARDWAISRNRYWGTPIPIWRSQDGECIVISSVQELEERCGKKIQDLHRHFIDDITFVEGGKEFHRIPEVFDCWFESGSMPYAQNHFPFENRQETLQAFPADFIAEGLDQTRGWFYTLTVLSSALFDKPAFKNVIVNGIILAEDGSKMSKRLKNYPEPELIINRYGADAIRLYLLSSPAVKAEDLRFSEKGVEQVLRSFLIPLWNSYHFLATYATIYHFQPQAGLLIPQTDIDRWILSRLQKLIVEVTREMDLYHLAEAVAPFVGFIEDLTNWYIRRCRSRFWSDEDTQDRRDAFQTLYTTLKELCKVAAPFIPFLSDAIFQQMRTDLDPLSVHLADFPKEEPSLRNIPLEQEMEAVMKVVSCGHALRKEQKIKVRQPLSSASILCADLELLGALRRQQQLIAEELNVKTVEFHSDESTVVQLRAKPNFRILGKKVGKKMNAVHKALESIGQKSLAALNQGRAVSLEVDGDVLELTSEDIAVERMVKEGIVALTQEGITLALNIHLTEELLMEGLARELVNKLNTMRREQLFSVTDRIHVTLETTMRLERCYRLHKDYICGEVLALSVAFGPCQGATWDLNGEMTSILIQKA